jgi:hypothetical protein
MTTTILIALIITIVLVSCKKVYVEPAKNEGKLIEHRSYVTMPK